MNQTAQLPQPPRAEQRPTSFERHGVTVTDDYAWLRADNWQQVMRDPSVLAEDIRAYLLAENAYTASAMQGTSAPAGIACGTTCAMTVPVGTTVEYKNSDSISHNVHTYPAKNEQLNATLDKQATATPDAPCPGRASSSCAWRGR